MDYPFHVHDVHISDPFVLADPVTGRYYLYAAHFSPDRFPNQKRRGAFHALVSEDLIHWSEPIQVFDAAETGFWADLDYWAPECHIWQGRYYIASTFRAEGTFRRCQFLVADSPLGPFKPIEAEPVTPKGWQCLDGTLYVDKSGKPWIVFCHEWTQIGNGEVCAMPLTDDLRAAAGEPRVLWHGADAPWVVLNKDFNREGYVTDGPFLWRTEDGTLLCLWASFSKSGYTQGLTMSDNGEIDGNFVHLPPIDMADAGHGMLFRDLQGQLWLTLHSPNVHPNERPHFIRMSDAGSSIACAE